MKQENHTSQIGMIPLTPPVTQNLSVKNSKWSSCLHAQPCSLPDWRLWVSTMASILKDVTVSQAYNFCLRRGAGSKDQGGEGRGDRGLTDKVDAHDTTGVKRWGWGGQRGEEDERVRWWEGEVMRGGIWQGKEKTETGLFVRACVVDLLYFALHALM